MTLSPLITPDELCRCSDVVVFDCRFDLMNPAAGRMRYLEAHIPGAHFADLNRDLSAPVTEHGGRHPIPSADAFAVFMRAAGVSAGSRVVAYDDNKGAFAARLWWLLRYFGHDQVQVLDGGLAAWRAAGLPLSQDEPTAKAGDFTAQPRAGWVKSVEDVAQIVRQGGAQLVDARDPERYRGDVEPIDPVGGHIPGAVNMPWVTAVAADGHFLPAEQQRARWQALPAGERVMYCGSGVTACANLLSLAIAGEPMAPLYAGSWSDWCSYPDLPVAKG